jgi:hypothetical protein
MSDYLDSMINVFIYNKYHFCKVRQIHNFWQCLTFPSILKILCNRQEKVSEKKKNEELSVVDRSEGPKVHAHYF